MLSGRLLRHGLMSIRAKCRPVKWLGTSTCMRLSIATVKILIGRKVQVLVAILESLKFNPNP